MSFLPCIQKRLIFNRDVETYHGLDWTTNIDTTIYHSYPKPSHIPRIGRLSLYVTNRLSMSKLEIVEPSSTIISKNSIVLKIAVIVIITNKSYFHPRFEYPRRVHSWNVPET